MSQGNEEKLKETFSRQNWILILSLVLTALIGGLFILGGFEIRSPGRKAGALHRWTGLAQRASVLGFRRGWPPPQWSQE